MSSWRRKGILDEIRVFKLQEAPSPPQGLHVRGKGTSEAVPTVDPGTRLAHQGVEPARPGPRSAR